MSVSSAEQARSAPSCTDRKIFLAKAVRAVAGVGVTAGVLAAPHQAGAEVRDGRIVSYRIRSSSCAVCRQGVTICRSGVYRERSQTHTVEAL